MSLKLAPGWEKTFMAAEPLDRKTEQALAVTIQAGGDGADEAVEMLVKHNTRFAVKYAREWTGAMPDMETLTGFAIDGLYDAAGRFQPRGYKFISYAVNYMFSHVQRGVAKHGRPVVLPARLMGMIGKIDRWCAWFAGENGRLPDAGEIEDEFGEIARSYQMYRTSPLYLDDTILREDGDRIHQENLVAEETSDKKTLDGDDSDLVESIFDAYKEWMRDRAWITEEMVERDNTALHMYFGIGYPRMTLDEVGLEIGTSRERVRQIKKRFIETVQTSRSFQWVREEGRVRGILSGSEDAASVSPAKSPAPSSPTTSRETSTPGEQE